jgi:hypothetical protein
MRTVVGVAPDLDALQKSFQVVGASVLDVRRIEEMPFWIATTTAQ